MPSCRIAANGVVRPNPPHVKPAGVEARLRSHCPRVCAASLPLMMGPSMKYVSLLTPRRCEKRSIVYLDSFLHAESVEQIAVTRNISTMGAMVECKNPPETGSTVILKCATLELEATVVWTLEQRLGLRFVQSLKGEF